MTAPGGAPGLPTGTVLTLENIQSRLQDLTATAMKGRAVEWFPELAGQTTGGAPDAPLSPFGFLTDLWARFNSTIANADPNAVNSVEDLGPLFLEFVEGLPVIGQFVMLLEALTGTYTGTDQVLLAVQAIFAPLRAMVLLIPGLQALLALIGINPGTGAVTGPGSNPLDALAGAFNQVLTDLFQTIFGQQSTSQAQINNQGSSGFTHDFGINGVTGWTALAGSFVLSARGLFVQAAAETVAYRASTVAAEKFGLHFVVAPSMRGVCRGGICAPSDGSSGLDLEVYRGFDGDALRVVTHGSPTLTVVHEQTDFIGASRLGDSVALDVRTDGVNKFTFLCNGQPVRGLGNVNDFEFVDSAGLVTHNATTRGVLLTSNGEDRDDDGFWGPAIQGKAVTYGTW